MTHKLTNTKLKAWFRRILRHPVRKHSGSILHPRTHTGWQRVVVSVLGVVVTGLVDKAHYSRWSQNDAAEVGSLVEVVVTLTED